MSTYKRYSESSIAPTRTVLENAGGLCQTRTHYDVEIEHYLMKLLDSTELDAAFILKHYGVDRAKLTDDLTRALDNLKSGNGRVPSLSPLLIKMLVQAWTIGSMELGAEEVRTGHTLFALVANEELRRVVFGLSKEFQKTLAGKAPRRVRGESSPDRARRAARASVGAGAAHKSGGKTPNLDQYTVDLTERAREGKLDPVLGRDFEVRQVVDILTRRRQNNPILVGEAGVGKTAIVEGFALRIANDDVPPRAPERHGPHARSGPAAGRRRHQGRVRESAQGPDRTR